jgi:hypothetical protein
MDMNLIFLYLTLSLYTQINLIYYHTISNIGIGIYEFPCLRIGLFLYHTHCLTEATFLLAQVKD